MALRSSRVSNEAWGTDSEISSTSLESDVYGQYKFQAKDLKPFLNTIADQVDFPAVALIWFSKEVIELPLTQDLLQFAGGEREKDLKVLEIFSQLKKQEDRVPFFLQALLESGDSSPTNRELYESLSSELGFSDSHVHDACRFEANRRLLRSKGALKKRRSGSSTSGIDSSMDSTRKVSAPPQSSPSTVIERHVSDDTQFTNVRLRNLEQENARLQQEIARLYQLLDCSFKMLTETQNSLTSAQRQLSTTYEKRQFEQFQSRRTSTQIMPSSQSRIRKVSRSLDSIQHELIQLQLESHLSSTAEKMKPAPAIGIPMLNQKSPRLLAKTTKGHK